MNFYQEIHTCERRAFFSSEIEHKNDTVILFYALQGSKHCCKYLIPAMFPSTRFTTLDLPPVTHPSPVLYTRCTVHVHTISKRFKGSHSKSSLKVKKKSVKKTSPPLITRTLSTTYYFPTGLAEV